MLGWWLDGSIPFRNPSDNPLRLWKTTSGFNNFPNYFPSKCCKTLTSQSTRYTNCFHGDAVSSQVHITNRSLIIYNVLHKLKETRRAPTTSMMADRRRRLRKSRRRTTCSSKKSVRTSTTYFHTKL
jgi:hypothetical protein